MFVDALICGFEDWQDIWGDPLLSGTIFVVSYGLTAFLIFRTSRNFELMERRYWRICSGLFLFQVFNTNLDLHAMVWTTGRCLAHAQDWYESRREVQIIFLIGVALILFGIVLLVLLKFYENIIRNLLLTAGVLIACGFTVVKGISFHGLGNIYNIQVGPFAVADFIEFSGVAIAFLATLRRSSFGKK